LLEKTKGVLDLPARTIPLHHLHRIRKGLHRRIVQSIPSPKAEPFKQWLAMTGSRRLDEMQADSLEAEREKYRLAGYDEVK